MIIKSVMALVLIFQTQHQMKGLTAVCGTVSDSKFYFLVLFQGQKTSFTSCHSNRSDRWEGSGLHSGAGVHEESPGNRKRTQTYEHRTVVSVLEVKSCPSNFQHNPGFMVSTKKLTKNSSSLMF